MTPNQLQSFRQLVEELIPLPAQGDGQMELGHTQPLQMRQTFSSVLRPHQEHPSPEGAQMDGALCANKRLLGFANG